VEINIFNAFNVMLNIFFSSFCVVNIFNNKSDIMPLLLCMLTDPEHLIYILDF